MSANRQHFEIAILWLSVTLSIAGRAETVSSNAHRPIQFERDILPVLSDNCFQCHGPDAGQRKGKLRLDDESAAKKERDGVAAIVPGDSSKSELIARITTTNPDDRMPPPDINKSLSPDQLALLKRWIDEGATWGTHWAFRELKQPPVPIVDGFGMPLRNPIDHFVSAGLRRQNLEPAREADKRTLLRRAHLDLTGLPPTPAEVEAFVADTSPDAYEQLVTRLLASPAYGERMAWDWMEAARYADSNGYQGDAERTMWPWRDWVVAAFNDNMPFDEFTTWQLAGDLLPNAADKQKLATGFHRNHPINGEGGRIAEENRVEYVMDMAETTGTVWLGLTFNCARCHDHKFDPISNRDYYSLFAFFNQTPVNGGGGNPQTPPVIDASSPEHRKQLDQATAAFRELAAKVHALENERFARDEGKKTGDSPEFAAFKQEVRDALNRSPSDRDSNQLELIEKELRPQHPEFADELSALRHARNRRDELSRRSVRVMVMEELKNPRKTFMLEVGFYNKPGEEVSAATPAKLPPMPEHQPRNRLGLARWLVSQDNPLTARVTVNRFWQMFFGAGLVKTSEDFGVQGQFPSHPDLLDWLAAEFRDSGWDVKRLVRLIVTSHTYRQSSRLTPELRERDPENRLLARGPRFRLPSWMIRDQALAASGLLSPQIGGAPIQPYQPEGVWEEATFGAKKYRPDSGEALYRRSLYIFWRRIVGPTMLFDTPSRMVCSVKPTRNNTPLHALTTLNDITYVEAARSLAQRAMIAANAPAERAGYIFQHVLARPANPKELTALRSGYDRALAQFQVNPSDAEALVSVGELKRQNSIDVTELAAWTAVALAVLNSDEALTKE